MSLAAFGRFLLGSEMKEVYYLCWRENAWFRADVTKPTVSGVNMLHGGFAVQYKGADVPEYVHRFATFMIQEGLETGKFDGDTLTCRRRAPQRVANLIAGINP